MHRISQAAIVKPEPISPDAGADEGEVQIADPVYDQRAGDIETLQRLVGSRGRGEMKDKLAELEKAQSAAVSPKMASASEEAKRRREAPNEPAAPAQAPPPLL